MWWCKKCNSGIYAEIKTTETDFYSLTQDLHRGDLEMSRGSRTDQKIYCTMCNEEFQTQEDFDSKAYWEIKEIEED